LRILALMLLLALILVYIILCVKTNRARLSKAQAVEPLGQNAHCGIVARDAMKR